MNEKMLNEGNQIRNFISSSGSGTVINYSSGSDFLTSYISGPGSGSTGQKVTIPDSYGSGSGSTTLLLRKSSLTLIAAASR